MSYRGQEFQSQNRPLIDLIPDENLHVDDEDDAFYAKEDDSLIHPEWKALVQRSTSRIPRRVQRFIVIYLILLAITGVVWKVWFGERYRVYSEELKAMDTEPEHAYGSNMRVVFKDIIHMKTMDEQHLPKDEKRLVFVGDVHGCIDELKALLEEVGFNKQNDHLILTGDIVSKGPNSAGVVALAQELGASCVRGNHEDKLLLSIAQSSNLHKDAVPDRDENPSSSTSDLMDKESLLHGDSKLRKLAKQFTKAQIQWLKECPVILQVGKVPVIGNMVVVHAGLVPGINLEDQDPYQCMNMRSIDLKTRLPSETRTGTEWEKFWNHQQKKQTEEERTTIVYGHDAKRGKNIKKYSKGLDSGCVKGGELTAMVIDSAGKEEFVSVACKGYA